MSRAEYCRDGETLQVAETGGCGSPATVRESRLCASGEWGAVACRSVFRRAHCLSCPNRQTVLVRQRIWDSLGIPAMLAQNARIDASCRCCNLEMLLTVENGRLVGPNDCLRVKNSASLRRGA